MTGVGQGIGRACAERYASDSSQVAVLDEPATVVVADDLTSSVDSDFITGQARVADGAHTCIKRTPKIRKGAI